MAASQRSAAADVGHGAGAGCCSAAGAAPEFLEVTLEGMTYPAAVMEFPSFVGFVTADDRGR